MLLKDMTHDGIISELYSICEFMYFLINYEISGN